MFFKEKVLEKIAYKKNESKWTKFKNKLKVSHISKVILKFRCT